MKDMKKEQAETLLTRKEVMEYLRISADTLSKVIRESGFPVYRIERKLLFRKAEVDTWLEKRRVK